MEHTTKKKSLMKDMTQGSPMKLILEFTLPMIFGFLFQQFYNMADTVIVGRFLGVHALASVGATGSINFCVIGFCMGVCNGFAIPVAQKFGAKDEVRLRGFVGNSALLAVLFAAVTTAVTVILCRPILEFMNTPSDIIDGAYNYIVVIFAGIPATYLYNLLSGYIRSLGDAKTPVVFLTISSLLNIVLDVLFIVVFHMGVAGAAWATVVSQAVSGILCFFYMIKHFPILRLKKEDWSLRKTYVSTLCKIGIPMGLQYSITAIGSVILQVAVNSLGSMAVAAVTAGSKIQMLLACPFDAMGSTMATYGGQNVGAKRLDRISQGLRSCVIIGGVYSVISLGIALMWGRNIAFLFINKGETELLGQIYMYLLGSVVCYMLLALVNIVRFLIQGMGFSGFAILAGVCEMAARSFVGFVLVPIFGFKAVCLGNGLAWIAADLFLIPAYFHVIKKLKRLFQEGRKNEME
ncbi:MAG: MATE family efflux transporter [Faecalicatena sp.]|uniref:MATE family efflux transporter n=1 Tax=Faecalicatena sp. TaxID=2005360 RepID=UPI002583F639|nr:MATE family efflux transporter [Faecalicatena sp.]MCI6465013.1 MATE family efflux transporter [Faecalicatena sp.]MDY5617156.1 MATE family efflux transporter [Lachnospiraceae bacterium]